MCRNTLPNQASVSLDNAPVIARKDQGRGCICLVSDPDAQQQHVGQRGSQMCTTSTTTTSDSATEAKGSHLESRAFGKKSKVPRPPNAFILYRQHWHPHFRQYNKSWHNNDISKELGRRWKAEPEHVKVKYKKLAEELKIKHAAQYPNYQYAPRKPGEKKRRMTARKLFRLRENQGLQESSTFPSSDSTAATADASFGQQKCSTTEERDHEFLAGGLNETEDVSALHQSISYQENDTYIATLPNVYDNIEAEIRRECGQYGQDYVDIIEDVNAREAPEEHLLHTKPSATFFNNLNEWESLIDWQGLNESFSITQGMAMDDEDVAAEQNAGPDVSYHQRLDEDLTWLERSSS